MIQAVHPLLGLVQRIHQIAAAQAKMPDQVFHPSRRQKPFRLYYGVLPAVRVRKRCRHVLQLFVHSAILFPVCDPIITTCQSFR